MTDEHFAELLKRESGWRAPFILLFLEIVVALLGELPSEQPSERQGRNSADESSGLKTLEGWQSNGDGQPYRQSWQSLSTP
jgi:hypothetical protein